MVSQHSATVEGLTDTQKEVS